MPTLVDRLKRIWQGAPAGTGASGTGIGVFALGGSGSSTSGYLGQGWDFLRIANTVYNNPTGYRCVEAITSNFARPSWMILPADVTWPSLANEVQALKQHPLLDLLNKPSDNVSATQMQRAMSRDLELSGKTFWLKMQGQDGFGIQGPTTGLRRLPCQRMTVVGNQDDDLLGFVYTDRNGQQRAILPDSLVYLRYPHAERIFDGLAPALVAGLPSETDTASARFNRDVLSSDAALPGYLILEGLTPDQFAEWKREWDLGAAPGKTRFISGTQAKYEKVGQTNQELTYAELRQDSQDDIMRAFGVPRAVAFDVSHETYANAEREQAIFMQHNVLPKWVLLCDELTLQLGAEFGVRIALDLAGIDELQDSRDAVTERGMKLMSMKAMTINEFRRSQGWPDVDWGDEPQAGVQPMSAVPLQPGKVAAPAETQAEQSQQQLAAPAEADGKTAAELESKEEAVNEGPVGDWRARHLIRWFNEGADGKIGWGAPGDFMRCVTIAVEHMPPGKAKGFCANRHHDALGVWPGQEDGGRHGHKSDMADSEDYLLQELAKLEPELMQIAANGDSAENGEK